MNARTHQVRNPHTGADDCQVQYADSGQIARTASGLRRHQSAWQKLGAPARCELLAQFADALDRRAGQIGEALIQDTGRLRESRAEVAAIAGLARRWAQQAPELLATGPARSSLVQPMLIHTRYIPYALVGVISPWNFPLLLSLIDAIPALAAGCAALIKPSEVTPRFVGPLQQAIAEVPQLQQVLGLVIGDGHTGQAVCEHADMLCFTGSIATGRKISALAGRRMIPVSLELGGKDAALVFADTDLPRAARAICWGGLTNAGQACQAIERIYVQRQAFDEFTALLVDCVKKLQLNNRNIAEGHLGPVIHRPQAAILRRHLADALAKGARCLTGGQVLQSGGGLWCAPTVLVDVSQDMAVMREESFGSILPVMPFDDERQALELANATDYGLSGAVFSADRQRAMRVAEQMQVGAVSVNDSTLTVPVHDSEKQSFGHSGLGGSRMGAASIRRFVRSRTLLENPSDGDSPWWFQV